MTVLHALYDSIKTWKYSHTNRQIRGFSGSSRMNRWLVYNASWTSDRYIVNVGMVVSGISLCRIYVTSSWNIGTEFIQPMGSVTKRNAPKGVWKGCVIARAFVDSSFVIAYVEIEDATTSSEMPRRVDL